MAYVAPSFSHLPNINWQTPPKTTTTSGIPSRTDINSVATKPNETQLQVAAENAPLRVVYGQARLGGQLTDAVIYKGKLYVLVVWCHGPINAIQQVWMDDAAIPSSVTAYHYLGTSSQTVCAPLVTAYGGNGITFTDNVPGVSYSVFVVPSGVNDGFPSFTALIKGREVYDPRTTVTAWSDNPALCLADFITDPIYGWGRKVDYVSVALNANVCDQIIGGEKRRLLGIALDKVSECRQWVEALRAYAGCWITRGQLGYKLVADIPS